MPAHLIAHLAPADHAAWKAQVETAPDPRSPPAPDVGKLFEVYEIDDDDPKRPAIARKIDPAAIVSAEWSSAETEIATDGTPGRVVRAKVYRLAERDGGAAAAGDAAAVAADAAALEDHGGKK